MLFGGWELNLEPKACQVDARPDLLILFRGYNIWGLSVLQVLDPGSFCSCGGGGCVIYLNFNWDFGIWPDISTLIHLSHSLDLEWDKKEQQTGLDYVV